MMAIAKLYGKRVNAREIGQRMTEIRLHRIVSGHFTVWYNRHNRLQNAGKVLTEITNFKVESDIFKMWRLKVINRRNF